MLWRILAVFLAAFSVDVLWTLTVMATAQRRVWRAAFLSVLLTFTGGYTTIEFVRRPLFLVVIAVASFLGTFLTLRIVK